MKEEVVVVKEEVVAEPKVDTIADGAGSPVYSRKEIDAYIFQVKKKMKMDLLAAKKKPEPKVCQYCKEHPCVMDLHL
jgi:hypothetical protein